MTCADIDAAVARARARGYDPGEVAGLQRATPTGAVLRWRLTLNATPGEVTEVTMASWPSSRRKSRAPQNRLTARR
jgi:hypothetical protein